MHRESIQSQSNIGGAKKKLATLLRLQLLFQSLLVHFQTPRTSSSQDTTYRQTVLQRCRLSDMTRRRRPNRTLNRRRQRPRVQRGPKAPLQPSAQVQPCDPSSGHCISFGLFVFSAVVMRDEVRWGSRESRQWGPETCNERREDGVVSLD